MAEFFFLITVIIMYGGINFYLYSRVQSALVGWFPGVTPVIFALLFWLVASLFLIAQISRHVIGYSLPVIIIKIGYYWMAVLFYSILLVALVDLVRLANRFLPWMPSLLQEPKLVSLAVLILVVIIVGAGAWNSRHPVITHYEVTLDKPAVSGSSLHLVMVSDIHLGIVVDKARLAELVTKINALNPDLVVLPGDVIDEDLQVVVREHMEDELRKIKSRYGVYACLGNHEYYSGHIDEVDNFMRQAGITLLRDQMVLIADSYYLAGRSMKSENPLASDKSIRLPELLADSDRTKPILVMDHVPGRLAEAAKSGVDLLLCGHTHLGQMWPLNFITQRVFVADYGLYQDQAFQAVISNGVGTWGPPIRVGNRPEIVDIEISFNQSGS